MAIKAPPVQTNPTESANLLIDLLPAMAWTALLDGTIEFVNQQCCVFTGLPREQLLGTGMLGCIHPDDLANGTSTLTARADPDAPFELEFRIRRHDGVYARCLARGAPVRDANGQLLKWVGTTIDVEDMRRATDRLKTQDENLELALASADIGIWRLTLPDQVLTVDERTRRHLDLDSNVVPNYRPEEHIHPDDYARAVETQTPRGDGRYVTEHRIKRRDGSYRWQATHWRIHFQGEGGNGAPALITGTSMDVTERKEAEAQREELRQRYAIALAAAELGTWSGRFDEGLMQLDERAQRHLNIDQPVVTVERYFASLDESDRKRIQQIRPSLTDGSRRDGRSRFEFRVDHPGGTQRWISTQLNITFDEKTGRPVRAIGVTRDITERKLAEERAHRLNVELERRVQERTAELTAANSELESFAYAVSHDLRGPLRAMWGFCDAIIEDHGDSLPAEVHEYLHHVIDGSRHLGEIIDGLLTLSRSTRGTLRRDAVDLSKLAKKILDELKRAEPERRVTWSIQPGLHARGDSRMVAAVMRNLLGNAWKYTTHRDDAHVRVYAETVDGEATFCVADNGAGFNTQHAEKLFQPFQRLHRQDEFSGLGIGLATVQRIVQRHGGHVSGTGVPDQGAIFRFTLPTPTEESEGQVSIEGNP